jgi:hypothetical protein
MINVYDYYKKNIFIISSVILVFSALILCGCNEVIEEKSYSSLPNGTKIYGDYNKAEISDFRIRTQAGTTNKDIITFGHWFTPENLPNITDEGEYIWAIYNITGQIKNIAGYTSNINLTIRFYNESNIFLFSDILYINKLNNNSSLEFNFIVDFQQKYFNYIRDIEFEIRIE